MDVEDPRTIDKNGSNGTAIWIVGLVTVAAIAAHAVWLRYELNKLRLEAMGTTVLARDMAANHSDISGRLEQLLHETQLAAAIFSEDSDRVRELLTPDPVEPLRKADEVRTIFEALGPNPSAESLAAVMQEVDEWLVEADDEDKVSEIKRAQLDRLRGLVRMEVEQLQEEALQARTSHDSAMAYNNAQQALLLYPMSSDETVTAEARLLMGRQAQVASKIQSLSRQRYNVWALSQIENALNYYNKNANKWNPLADNVNLIDPLVEHLQEVDPAFLEPIVLDLYNYVLEQVKGSLSEPNLVAFAKKLSAPAKPRMSPDDL